MTSIFERALGADFGRLHPQLQRRFGFSSSDGIACIGYGWMDQVWHRSGLTWPFLALGAKRHILVRGQGRHVPFAIENYAYLDRFGRETVTFARTFWFGSGTFGSGRFGSGEQHWDATMVYHPQRAGIVDYLGTHQHLAVGLHLSVDQEGSLMITSGWQRIHEAGLRLPVPPVATGTASLRESYDDEAGLFRIEVSVANHRFGPLLHYQGSFIVTYQDSVAVPSTCRPVRETMRA